MDVATTDSTDRLTRQCRQLARTLGKTSLNHLLKDSAPSPSSREPLHLSPYTPALHSLPSPISPTSHMLPMLQSPPAPHPVGVPPSPTIWNSNSNPPTSPRFEYTTPSPSTGLGLSLYALESLDQISEEEESAVGTEEGEDLEAEAGARTPKRFDNQRGRQIDFDRVEKRLRRSRSLEERDEMEIEVPALDLHNLDKTFKVDLWLSEDELLVGESEATLSFESTLTRVYINPLVKLFRLEDSIQSSSPLTHRRRRSSIFDNPSSTPTPTTLRLVITLRNHPRAAFQYLLNALSPLVDLDCLTSHDIASNYTTFAPVTVSVRTDSDSVKEDIKSLSPRFCFLDVDLLHLQQEEWTKAVVPIVSLEWQNHYSANEELSSAIREAIQEAKKRQMVVRVSGVQASDEYVRRELSAMGVDWVETM